MSSLVFPRSRPSTTSSSLYQQVTRDEQPLGSSPCVKHAPQARRPGNHSHANYNSVPAQIGVWSPRSGFIDHRSHHRSSDISVKLALAADLDLFGSVDSTPATRQHRLLLNIPRSANVPTDSLPSSGPRTNCAVSRNPSSMSHRRLASNRPVLQCKVDMPPATIFPSELSLVTTPSLLTPGNTISPLPLSLRQFSLAYSKTRTSCASPITPVEQIMPKTPLSPPPLENNSSSFAKSKPRNTTLPTWMQPARVADYTPDSPILGLALDLYGAQCGSPISPLGISLGDTLSIAPSPLATSRAVSPSLTQAAPLTDTCNIPGQGDDTASKVSKNIDPSISSCPGPQAFLRARARPPLRLSLPRRLSYNRTGLACSPGGTLTPRGAGHELASPAFIGLKAGSGTGTIREGANVGMPETSTLLAHQPRMVELGSYF